MTQENEEARVLVLGSSSRWRRKVLEDAGLTFVSVAPDIDEKAIRDPDAYDLTAKIARAKAQAVIPQLNGRPALVIASDQVAVFRGEIIEKPESAAEARRFLRAYRGETVDLVTAVVVVDTVNGVDMDGHDVSRLSFGAIPDEAIERLIERGDVLKSCGAIVVEDPDMAPWVRTLMGTPDSVDGMPLGLLRNLLQIHDYAFV